MSKTCPEIDAKLAEWIGAQRMFFVASAPVASDGHVNCSPKGGDALRVLGPREVVYQDFTGSGAETAAHVRENGRIVVMFCAFQGAPRIVRLHGRGTLVTEEDARFAAWSGLFPENPGTRAFVHVAIVRVSVSCGYSVPRFEFQGQRDGLNKWAVAQGAEGLVEYRAKKNARSIDGLPAFGGQGLGGK